MSCLYGRSLAEPRCTPRVSLSVIGGGRDGRTKDSKRDFFFLEDRLNNTLVDDDDDVDDVHMTGISIDILLLIILSLATTITTLLLKIINIFINNLL